MSNVLLIYPFFIPHPDRSVFRFPPLGIAYIAACLQKAGHEVHLIDCTFRKRNDALREAQAIRADVIGIYCMVTLLDDCLWFASHLRGHCNLLVAGGPLPTCEPDLFLDHFDVVVRGEGEQTMLELIDTYRENSDPGHIPGIVYRKKPLTNNRGETIYTLDREYIQQLDQLPFPARDLLPNGSYIRYGQKKYGYSITTVMSSRGCPYRCEFCSNVIFGGSFRECPPRYVVDDIEAALKFGYDRISFADDVFTMDKNRVIEICKEIKRRGLHFQWECLGRVDALDCQTALAMKEAGCTRIFFGIESGSDKILKLMTKKITAKAARNTVLVAHQAGLQVGAFFILCYPGDTDATVLETLRFATSLPLDYLGLSMPYPLPGTALEQRVKDRDIREWNQDGIRFIGHVLIFNSDFSGVKMSFAIFKGHAQFEIKRRMGKLAPVCLNLFEYFTDAFFRLMR